MMWFALKLQPPRSSDAGLQRSELSHSNDFHRDKPTLIQIIKNTKTFLFIYVFYFN